MTSLAAGKYVAALRSRPLVWLCLLFMAGLLLAGLLAPSLWLAGAATALGLALLFVRRAPAWIGIAFIGLALGVARYATFTSRPADDISHLVSPAPVSVIGTVASDPDTRPGRTLFLLDCQSVETHAGPLPATGTVYVSLIAYARDDAPLLSEGDRVSLDGILEEPEGATNPGAFSWRDYLARRAIWCQMRVRRPGAVVLLGHPLGSVWLNTAWRVRRALERSIRAGLSPEDAAVVSGILLGRRADLPPALMADFVATGTVHILATAGLHVGIVALLLMALFERVTLPRKLSAALMIATLWLYALVAGGRPSVTRAALMASVYFGAILFERAPDLLTSLAAAALLVLWLQPTAIFEPAFQMSFATVLGLIVLMPIWTDFLRDRLSKLTRGWRRAGTWAWELAGLSLVAQLAAAPVVAQAYNQVSVLGVFANLCVVPLLFLLIPAGFLAAIAGCISRVLGGVLFHVVVAPLLHALVALVVFFANLPGASLSVAPLPLSVIFAYYGVLYGGSLLIAALARARARSGAARGNAAAGNAPAGQPRATHDGA